MPAPLESPLFLPLSPSWFCKAPAPSVVLIYKRDAFRQALLALAGVPLIP